MIEPGDGMDRHDFVEAPIFLRHLGRLYDNEVMDMEVFNESTKSLDINLKEICIYSSNHESALPHSVQPAVVSLASRVSLPSFARHPEEMDLIIHNRLKRAAAATAFFTLLSIGLAVHDGLQDGKDARKETWTVFDAQRAAGRDVAVRSSLILADVSHQSQFQAQEEYHFLPSEAFPEGAIGPGESRRGKIFLPVARRYRYMRVVVPMAGNYYIFDFRR